MPAAATDLLQKVGSPGTATTLSAPGYTVGNGSITVGSTSNWPTDTGVTFAIDQAQVVNGVEVQIAGSYNEYVGTVASGTSVTNVSWILGTGNRNYASGALTRVYIPVSANRENRIVTWGLTHSNQDGTLKTGAVTANVLAANSVTPAAMDTNTNVETRLSESLGDFVASGLVWSQSSGLNGTMTSGVAYVSGKRLVVSSIASRAFTASKDTYVSLDSSGTVSYSEVANNAAPPTLPANSAFVAVVTTSGSAITSVSDGSYIKQAYVFTDQPLTNAAYSDLGTVGPSVTINVPRSGKVRVAVHCGIYGAAANTRQVSFAATGANTIAATDQAAARNDNATAAIFSNTELLTGLAPGLTTFTMKYKSATAGNFFARKIIVEGLR